MKKTSTAVLSLVATLAVTAPAIAGPCVTAKFTAYDKVGFSCTVGDKTFSRFTYTQTTANAPAASTVSVIPVSIANEEGFSFTGNWAAANFGTTGVVALDASWTFKVQTTNGQPLIDDAINTITGSRGSPAVAVLSETLTFPKGSTTTLDVNLTTRPTRLKKFAPVDSLLVTKDLAELIGPGGFATISVDSQLYSQLSVVPEPASLALVGVGLTGIGLVRRRRSK